MMKTTLADSWTYKTNYWLLAPPTDKTTFQWQLQYNWTQRMWLVFIKTIPHTLYQNVQNVQWQKVKTVKKTKKQNKKNKILLLWEDKSHASAFKQTKKIDKKVCFRWTITVTVCSISAKCLVSIMQIVHIPPH